MKLAVLPWILMLLSSIPGPGLTAGMPHFALLTPPLFICLISQALSRYLSGLSVCPSGSPSVSVLGVTGKKLGGSWI